MAQFACLQLVCLLTNCQNLSNTCCSHGELPPVVLQQTSRILALSLLRLVFAVCLYRHGAWILYAVKVFLLLSIG